ncbi:unnamed protein product [Cochlearia groenlandica]
MVQRKTCQETKPYNLKQETRFFGQEHLKILGPEMMMMKKRTKPKRKLKEHTVSHQSGNTQTPSRTHDDLVARSPNYMKGTSSSEARKEKNKRIFDDQKKNQLETSPKHVSCYGLNKEKGNKNKPISKIVKGLRKAMSFKRCSQRATCSSTLKDSKFPKYLMLNHHDDVNGTSVLKVCPYKYCSLNGHLHAPCPPLKSFISSRRQSLKSQKSVKMKDFVEMMCVDKKKEYDLGAFETQISETISQGAPCSETDSDDSEMVKISEDDHSMDSKESYLEENLEDDSMEETCDVEAVSQISETVPEEEPCSETESNDLYDSVDMVTFSEGDHSIIDSIEFGVEEKANKDEDAHEVIGMIKNSETEDTDEETQEHKAKDFKQKSQDNIEVVSMIDETSKILFNKEEDLESTVSRTNFGRKKPLLESDDSSKDFNPREPSYLPLVPDPDAEKVDLKHQDMDERRNSEDWMFDYALQRAVTKLSSSARKRKVALLVEAFETVHVKPNDEPIHVLSCGRHLQACN